MILPQLEARRHGADVVGMMFFDDNNYILRAGDPTAAPRALGGPDADPDLQPYYALDAEQRRRVHVSVGDIAEQAREVDELRDQRSGLPGAEPGAQHAELPGQRVQDRHWNRQRVFQKGAKITNRTKLHGESKPVMPTALLRDQCLVNVVEKEATGEVIG